MADIPVDFGKTRDAIGYRRIHRAGSDRNRTRVNRSVVCGKLMSAPALRQRLLQFGNFAAGDLGTGVPERPRARKSLAVPWLGGHVL
ncbi:MAG: hypothetical protein CMJ75_11435 [Planctomycetaceae bacterium]|nr:hypothetical protein [Planctomycetaceae bacterium]